MECRKTAEILVAEKAPYIKALFQLQPFERRLRFKADREECLKKSVYALTRLKLPLKRGKASYF